MIYSNILIVDGRSSLFTLRVALEQRYDVSVRHARDAASAFQSMNNSPPDYILINSQGIEDEITTLLTQLAEQGQDIPLIIAGDETTMGHLRAIYPHVRGYVPPAYNEGDLLPFLQKQPSPTRTGKLRGMALAERAALVQTNQLLERRMHEMMTLHQIGRSVASLTNLDAILTRIAEAAVYLSRAEEGSIMLVDPETNKLYLRAEKGLGEKQAKGFNLQINDTLIGSVVRTGNPVVLSRGHGADSRLKVVTGYLVNALLYVPLTLRGQVIGVLGVSNQTAPRAFTEHDVRLMGALADYAALAIEVARQHRNMSRLRQDLAVSHTISATVQELRQRLPTNDPVILSALARIENAAHILTRMADVEAPISV
ncbi:MAG: GAF domain-containing protein [Anaerolineae bacterium]|jgi:two-component system NtrC family sensor kinase